MIFVATKTGRSKNCLPPPLLVMLLDPGSGINIPDPQHCSKSTYPSKDEKQEAGRWCLISERLARVGNKKPTQKTHPKNPKKPPKKPTKNVFFGFFFKFIIFYENNTNLSL
jgi:hypothetical protein